MADTNLEGFIEAVNAEAESKINEIMAEAEEKKNHMLEKAENDALSKAYSEIRSAVTEAKTKSRMAVSKAEQESRIKVLTHREELVKKIFNAVEEKIVSFTSTENYEHFLCGLLKDEIIDNETVIYLKPDDMKYVSLLKNVCGCECSFEEDTEIRYGGLSIYSQKDSVMVNMTIDNMLDEERKNFGSKYKLA